MERWDEFTLEGGWSTDANFPYDILPEMPVDYPDRGVAQGQPVNGRFRFRVPELWCFPAPEYMWKVSDRAGLNDFEQFDREMQAFIEGTPQKPKQDLVDLAIDNAIDRILQHVIPYYHDHMRSLGLTPSD